jgi:hypothetical protein
MRRPTATNAMAKIIEAMTMRWRAVSCASPLRRS